jgi:hypothetical protein
LRKECLRKIFGTEKEEVAGGWRRMHNEELHNLYASPNIMWVMKSSRMGWAGHVARMGEMKAHNILVGNPEGKRPLGRSKRIWENRIRMDIRKIGWEVVDWLHLAQDGEEWRSFVNTVMNLRVP